MPDEIPARALVVAAHPDDIDFGAAGTVATWTAAGAEVAYCVVTDGDAGGFDLDVDRSSMAAIRRDEQRAAASAVGVEQVEFLGWPDGRLVAELDLRRDIAAVIRRHRPDRVLCPSPERSYERLAASHPDHLAAGEATICAIYPDARNPFAFPELLRDGLEPHTVHELWLMASPTPNHVVDITEVIDRKIAALMEHKSQLPDPAATEERVRSWTAAAAAGAGLGEGRHAEVFSIVQVP
jgi:LmbE family N-acetylglucosaminyl deacetylase